MGVCFKCGTAFAGKPARGDDCDKCRQALRCCMNCKHYDTKAYNSCKESQAERVVDKERGNFCDYFAPSEGKSNSAGTKADQIKRLDDLFK